MMLLLARGDEGGIIFFNCALFFVILVIAVLAGRHAAKKWAETLRVVAERFPGMTVEKGGWLNTPKLRHFGSGWQAIVSFFGGSKNSSPYTRVEFQLEKSVPVLKLTPQGFFSGVSKFFGAQDIEIGVPEFDSRYMIAAQPPEFARTFLDGGARRAVEGIRSFSDGLAIDVSGRSARVNLAKCLRDPQTICAYLNSTFGFVGLLTSARGDTGIQVISETTTGEGVCQVCGQAIAADPVRCRKCRTPHHRECWTYLGGCSTFACGEKKFE